MSNNSKTISVPEPAERRRQALKVVRRLKKKFPTAECALHHESAFQLLVATILSAQCTDERVNKVTPVLFERFLIRNLWQNRLRNRWKRSSIRWDSFVVKRPILERWHRSWWTNTTARFLRTSISWSNCRESEGRLQVWSWGRGTEFLPELLSTHMFAELLIFWG